MKLEQLKENGALMHCERYVNQRRYSSHSEYTEVNNEYLPREGLESFQISLFCPKNANVLTASPSQKIIQQVTKRGSVFALHPDMIGENNQTIKELILSGAVDIIDAQPTASTRTLHCPSLGCYLKLHLNKRISRYNRRLRAGSVHHSILVSQDLDASSPLPCFAYLPETIGVIAGEGDNAIGMIVREEMPRPIVPEKRFLIPYFSLWSRDEKNLYDAPLLVQLITYHKASPLHFFLEKIVEPIIMCWVWAAKERGILMESHGQNILLEIDNNFIPTRIVHRDFQSLVIDCETRAEKKLPMPFTKHCIGRDEPSREIEYSLVYDLFVSEYMFSHLIKPMTQYFGTPAEVLQAHIKKCFRKHFSDWKKYFPENAYYCLGRVLDRINENEILRVDEPPTYR